MKPFSNQILPLPDNLLKPEIFPLSLNPYSVNSGDSFRKIYSLLKQGKNVCLTGAYGFALAFYSWLKKQNNNNFPVNDYQTSRANREHLRLLNQNLYIVVWQHYANLNKAPDNPWLKVLYPQENEFLIRFSDFLGMNGSWQWYSRGIKFPVLDHLVHPFFGVYFPTRHEHLLLFDTWLKKNHHFDQALDIGTGCGVLALMMLKHGISFVHATDINPNAVYSTEQEFNNRGLQTKTHIEQAPYAGSYESVGNDLIVCNPPWIQAQTATELDLATYYEYGFFEEFFSTVHNIMKPGTMLAILFSDFAKVAAINDEHPIENEIHNKSRFLLIEKLETPTTQKTSVRKNWLGEIRRLEKIQLWVMRVGT